MSHFFLIALVHPHEDDVPLDQLDENTECRIETEIYHLARPYSEHLEIDPPVEQDCYCRQNGALLEAERQTEEKFGKSIRDYWDIIHAETKEKFYDKESWISLPSPDREAFFDRVQDYNDVREEELMTEWREEAQRLYNELLPTFPADPECNDGCNGSGVEVTSWNRDNQYDWLCFGGRYDGIIHGTPQTDQGYSYGAPAMPLRAGKNITTVDELLDHEDRAMCYGLLTPDGKWISRRYSGWMHYKKPMSKWRAEIKSVLEQHRGCYAVGVDCHS